MSIYNFAEMLIVKDITKSRVYISKWVDMGIVSPVWLQWFDRKDSSFQTETFVLSEVVNEVFSYISENFKIHALSLSKLDAFLDYVEPKIYVSDEDDIDEDDIDEDDIPVLEYLGELKKGSAVRPGTQS